MPENAVPLVLLPYSDAGLAPDTAGTVALGDEQQALRTLAGLFPADHNNSPRTDLLCSEGQALRMLEQGETASWRGLLAFALLADCWQPAKDDPRLQLESYHENDSAWTKDAFRALSPELRKAGLHLLTLCHGKETFPLGLLSSACAIVPTIDPIDLSGHLPARATWFHPTAGRFRDPVSRLCETDRAILLERLRRLQQAVHHPALKDFADDLAAAAEHERKLLSSGSEVTIESLRVRIAAVTTLADEPDSRITSVRSDYELKSLQHCLLLEYFHRASGIDRLQPVITWTVRGIPFAVESPMMGLLPAHHPQEGEALAYLQREMALMSANSTRWNKKLAENYERFRNDRRGTGLQPEIVQLLKRWRQNAEALSEQKSDTLHLYHPWTATPVAAASLLREALGAAGADFADPFSSRLVLMPEGPDPAYADEALAVFCRPMLGG